MGFDSTLSNHIGSCWETSDRPIPFLATGAGHDAAILGTMLPTAMIFVRNPTGVSHAPAEVAEDKDCVHAIHLLSLALERLVTEPAPPVPM